MNAIVKTINKLEETVYYQGSCTIEDYLDEFQTLDLEVSYTNLYTIVIKFCCELQTII